MLNKHAQEFPLQATGCALEKCRALIVLFPFLRFRSVQAVLDNTRINPADIGDIVVGTVLGPSSQRAIECRTAALFAGFPGNTCVCDHAS